MLFRNMFQLGYTRSKDARGASRATMRFPGARNNPPCRDNQPPTEGATPPK